MRKLVYFDGTSNEDLGLVFLDGEIGDPEVRTMGVDVPYRDGILDLTDYYGNVRFKNRTITLEFVVDPAVDREEAVEKAMRLNGKRVKLEVPNRPGEYFMARLKVRKPKITNSPRLDLTVTADAEPYCYEDITIIRSFSATGDVVCPNKEMITSPTIVTDAAITAVFGTTTVTLAAGEHYVSAFRFTEGNNTITITPTSSANVKILYTRGRQ